jgi:ribosomal protein S18 acetylase RimI-like enzyme
MNEPEIIISESISESERQFVIRSLVAYNNTKATPETWREVNVLARQNMEIVGALLGQTHWNWLFVKTLWVADPFRRLGLGRKLMLAAEREAAARGCLHAHLDTFDFQALPFYQKLGYQIFGQLEDYPIGHRRYFLQKRNLPEAVKG